MKKLKVFEMFAGYGGASFALKKAGINFECVGFSEIDKYAIECYNNNHYEILDIDKNKNGYSDVIVNPYNYGDAKKIKPEELPNFDLLTGGFPCQAFSIAGKREGFEDTRGTLIYDILRIAKIKKPKYMLLENVKGLINHDNGKTFSTIINAIKNIGYDVRYKVLNTKDYGIPQNRERIWIICQLEQFIPFIEIFPIKEKLDIIVKDILEKNVDKKYYLSKKQINRLNNSNFNPSIAHTLTGGGNSGGNHSDMDCFKVADYRKDQGLRIRKDNCAPSLCSNKGGISPVPIIHTTQPRSGDPKKGGTGLLNRKDGLTYCLDTGNTQAIEIGKIWRRLTPLECTMLMGFKKGEINLEGLSNTQIYKLMGNGWDVNLVSKIFKTWLGDY